MKMSAVTNFDLNGQRVRVEDGYERVISFRMFDLRRILDRILQESWVEENTLPKFGPNTSMAITGDQKKFFFLLFWQFIFSPHDLNGVSNHNVRNKSDK